MFQTLLRAIFVGDPEWAWRRRVTFAGCAVALWGVIHAILFEPDHAWGAVVLTNCWAAFGATLTIYATLATYDKHSERKIEAGKAQP
jgi:hypothetical protein